jgi:DNA oxidative demethylase
MKAVELVAGVLYWPGRLGPRQQEALGDEIAAALEKAPFFRPAMPGSGRSFSVEMTNFGPLGWLSDRDGGYRYAARHPVTGTTWPPIPETLDALWHETTGYGAPPEACLVNLYRPGARMGLHQDRDEKALDAPVLSISLGDSAIFRFGAARQGPTQRCVLASGDVLVFGGPARMMFHGIDRVLAGSSRLIAGGGRINLTLRRVTVAPNDDGRLGG